MEQDLYVHKVENGLMYFGEDGKQTKPVSDKVNPKYIKQGMAEVSERDGVVCFIKMKPKHTQQSQDSPQPTNLSIKDEREERRSLVIARQSSLDKAIKILELRKDKEFDIAKIKEIAEDLVDWVVR